MLYELWCKRAKGLCEYCLISEEVCFSKHHIDHVIAEKHGGLTVESNLALSCSTCNKFREAIFLQLMAKLTKLLRFSIRENIFGANILKSKTDILLV